MQKKNFIYYFSSSIISSGLGFLIAIYMSKVLLPEEYGYIGLFGAMLYLTEPLVAFFSFGLLEINLVKDTKDNYEEFKKKLINFTFLNFFILSILSFLISLYFKEYKELFFYMVIIVLTRFFLKILWVELVQKKEAKKYFYYFTVYSFLMFFLTVLFISFFSLGWQGRIYALILSEIILVIYFYKKYNFKLVFFNKKEYLEVIKFGLPLFIGLGAAWILQEADKIIVLKYFDLSIVGIYTFAYLIGKAMQIFNQTIVKIIRPIYYEKLKNNNLTVDYHIKELILYGFILMGLATMSMLVLYYLKDILLNENYVKGYNIIIIIFYSFAFFGIYQVSSIILEFKKLNKLKTILVYIAAFLNLIFSVLLIGKFGILSPAYGTLVGFIILALLSIIFSINILKKDSHNV